VKDDPHEVSSTREFSVLEVIVWKLVVVEAGTGQFTDCVSPF
jgi:hypothetical protein